MLGWQLAQTVAIVQVAKKRYEERVKIKRAEMEKRMEEEEKIKELKEEADNEKREQIESVKRALSVFRPEDIKECFTQLNDPYLAAEYEAFTKETSSDKQFDMMTTFWIHLCQNIDMLEASFDKTEKLDTTPTNWNSVRQIFSDVIMKNLRKHIIWIPPDQGALHVAGRTREIYFVIYETIQNQATKELVIKLCKHLKFDSVNPIIELINERWYNGVKLYGAIDRLIFLIASNIKEFTDNWESNRDPELQDTFDQLIGVVRYFSALRLSGTTGPASVVVDHTMPSVPDPPSGGGDPSVAAAGSGDPSAAAAGSGDPSVAAGGVGGGGGPPAAAGGVGSASQFSLSKATNDSIPGHSKHPPQLGVCEIPVNIVDCESHVDPTLEADPDESHCLGAHPDVLEFGVREAHGLELLAGGPEPNNVSEVAVEVPDGVGGPLCELDGVLGLATSVEDPEPDVGLEFLEFSGGDFPAHEPVEVDGVVLLDVPPAEGGLELGAPPVDPSALSGTQADEHTDKDEYPLYQESKSLDLQGTESRHMEHGIHTRDRCIREGMGDLKALDRGEVSIQFDMLGLKF